MKWALVNAEDIIVNVILYDADAPYTPPEGTFVMEVNDWLNIGDPTTKPEPTVIDNLAANYTMEQRRGFCMASLFQLRDQELAKNITVGGNTFYSDNESISVLHQAITIQGLQIDTVFPADWIVATGGTVSLSYSDAQALASAIATRKNAAFANYVSLANEIAIAEVPELVDINQGWPN